MDAIKPSHDYYLSFDHHVATEPRAKTWRLPTCMKHTDGLNPCDIETRIILRKELKKQERQKRKDAGESVDSYSSDDDVAPRKYKRIDNLKRYENQERGIYFDLQQERKDVFLHNPFPGNDRFEPPKAHEQRFEQHNFAEKIDQLGHHRNTLQAPDLSKTSPRKEPTKWYIVPDSQHYCHLFP